MKSFSELARASNGRTARRLDAEASVNLSKRRAWYANGQPMLESTFPDITNLGLILREVFYDQLQAVVDPGQEILSLFNMGTSTNAVERSLGMGGFGRFPVYTGTLNYATYDELYIKTYTPLEFAMAHAVERKLWQDDIYGVIGKRVEQMGVAADRSIYMDGADEFNNAFATSYTRFDGTVVNTAGGDGKALCATDHPLGPNVAGTQSNAGMGALTYANVIAARQAMMSFTDSKGFPLLSNPDILLVPVGLDGTADTIMQSPGDPGTANRAANVTNNYGLRKVTSRYLTDSNNWFLIDSRLAAMYNKWYWLTRPEFVNNPMSEFELVFSFRGYSRYSLGFDAWWWIYGNNVS